MGINVGYKGAFDLTIEASQLSKGLRPSNRAPRNSGFLTACEGAIGRDGTLQSIDELTRLATTEITDGFPWPQIFVCTNIIIVCGPADIYELVSGALVLQLSVSTGLSWAVADFYEYVYMSNGVVSVVRDAMSKTYSIVDNLPIANAVCNFNGQIVVGGLV